MYKNSYRKGAQENSYAIHFNSIHILSSRQRKGKNIYGRARKTVSLLLRLNIGFIFSNLTDSGLKSSRYKLYCNIKIMTKTNLWLHTFFPPPTLIYNTTRLYTFVKWLVKQAKEMKKHPFNMNDTYKMTDPSTALAPDNLEIL